MEPDSIEVAAERMIKRYGKTMAEEYAMGYATGVYFKQSQRAKDYWLAVAAAIKANRT